MNSLFTTTPGMGIIGFMTSFIGLIIGILSSSIMNERGRRFRGTILGLLGGFMLGVVCFDLLPEVFATGSIIIAVTGLSLGLVISVIMDGKLEQKNDDLSSSKNNLYWKAAVFMALGIGIHNLPSGVALGSLITAAPSSGFHLALALILHGIPEGLAIGLLMAGCGSGKWNMFIVSIITSIPLGIGSMMGSYLKSPEIICVSLAFASAMILYVTLGETLPAASDTWSGRMTTIGNVIGIIIGMIMVSFFH